MGPVQNLRGSLLSCHSGGQILAPSRRNAEPFFFEHLLEAIESTPYNEKNYFKFINEYVFLSSLPATDWSIAYVYRSFILNEGQIFLFLFLLGAGVCHVGKLPDLRGS